MSHAALLPFQPEHMNAGQQAAVSYLARYSGHTRRPRHDGRPRVAQCRLRWVRLTSHSFSRPPLTVCSRTLPMSRT